VFFLLGFEAARDVYGHFKNSSGGRGDGVIHSLFRDDHHHEFHWRVLLHRAGKPEAQRGLNINMCRACFFFFVYFLCFG